MKSIKIDDKQVVEVTVDVLENGGLVMHPTETCYGFAVDIFDESALQKLYREKEMGLDKPVSILVSDLGMAMEYGVFSDKAIELAKYYWPGPLSILVPRSRKLPEFLNPGNDFVSLRFSDLGFCINMVKEFGQPVTTTSANKSGEPPLYKACGGEFKELDLLVDGGEISYNKPSTIVKVVGDEIEVLRYGSIIL